MRTPRLSAQLEAGILAMGAAEAGNPGETGVRPHAYNAAHNPTQRRSPFARLQSAVRMIPAILLQRS